MDHLPIIRDLLYQNIVHVHGDGLQKTATERGRVVDVRRFLGGELNFEVDVGQEIAHAFRIELHLDGLGEGPPDYLPGVQHIFTAMELSKL